MTDADATCSTGDRSLDRALGGGVPSGHLVALTAPPRAQSEPLLYVMAAANRTRYLSTLRPVAEVREAFAATVGEADAVDIRGVDGDAVLDQPERYLEGLDAGTLVVIDPSTELEQGDRERYRHFLDTCKRALRMTDSVGLLHCHENNPATLRRDMTLARADQVWDVRVEVIESEVRTRLAVTKCRGGVPFGTLDLSFDTEGFAVNPSR